MWVSGEFTDGGGADYFDEVPEGFDSLGDYVGAEILGVLDNSDQILADSQLADAFCDWLVERDGRDGLDHRDDRVQGQGVHVLLRDEGGQGLGHGRVVYRFQVPVSLLEESEEGRCVLPPVHHGFFLRGSLVLDLLDALVGDRENSRRQFLTSVFPLDKGLFVGHSVHADVVRE